MLPSSSSGSMQSANTSFTSSSLNFSPGDEKKWRLVVCVNHLCDFYVTHPRPLNCVPIQRGALCRLLVCRTTSNIPWNPRSYLDLLLLSPIKNNIMSVKCAEVFLMENFTCEKIGRNSSNESFFSPRFFVAPIFSHNSKVGLRFNERKTSGIS